VRSRRLLLLLTCASQLGAHYQQPQQLAAANEEARSRWLAALQGAAAERGLDAGAVSVLLVELKGGLGGQEGLGGAAGPGVQTGLQVKDALLRACREGRRAVV
jgi:hypothetical protein